VLSWFHAPSSSDGHPVELRSCRVRADCHRLSLRHAARHEAGQELVEFALILPLLLLLLLGIIEFGRAILAYNTIANAAREGARYGIVDPNTGPIQTAALVLTTGLAPPLVAGDITVTISSATVEVAVDYDFPPLLAGFLGLPATIPLHTQATMQREQ
jgi:Flp pilus assembly protein TadG